MRDKEAMMYVQITEQCNMACPHCCFSAMKKRSEQMSRANFMYALQLAVRYGETFTIGGGEPTLHKEIFAFIDKAMEFYYCKSLDYPPFMVTNGKLKTKAHKLLDMVEEGEPLCVELSQDPFHDPIDPSVVRRFYAASRRYRSPSGFGRSDNGNGGIVGIRDTSGSIQAWGRAKKNNLENAVYKQECVCDDVFVDPQGRVWSCGCKTHQLGWVWQQDVLDGYDREFAHEGGRDPDLAIELEIESAADGDQSEMIDVPAMVS